MSGNWVIPGKLGYIYSKESINDKQCICQWNFIKLTDFKLMSAFTFSIFSFFLLFLIVFLLLPSFYLLC